MNRKDSLKAGTSRTIFQEKRYNLLSWTFNDIFASLLIAVFRKIVVSSISLILRLQTRKISKDGKLRTVCDMQDTKKFSECARTLDRILRTLFLNFAYYDSIFAR